MATQPIRHEQQQPQIDQERLQRFVETLVNDVATAMRGGLCYIGDKLGIFKALANSGKVTLAELAQKTGLNERYLKEWLHAMVTAEYVYYDPWAKTYFLPPEHALPLANEDFPYFVGGFLEMIVPTVSMAPKIAESFRSGRGVPQSQYPVEMFESIERGTMPWYKNQLIQNWLPTMPQVAEKLQAGGTALDTGCGGGRAVITIAQAFPNAHVYGFDNHPGSIERARRNAEEAGVADHTTFEVRDCKNLPENAYDLVTSFDVIHDSVDPVGILSSVRRSLKPDGTYLWLEMNCAPDVNDNINPVGRFLYSVSTLYCMTVSLAHDGAGIGAAMGEPKARELATQAGFSHFRRLPIDDPFSMLYELRK